MNPEIIENKLFAHYGNRQPNLITFWCIDSPVITVVQPSISVSNITLRLLLLKPLEPTRPTAYWIPLKSVIDSSVQEVIKGFVGVTFVILLCYYGQFSFLLLHSYLAKKLWILKFKNRISKILYWNQLSLCEQNFPVQNSQREPTYFHSITYETTGKSPCFVLPK